jgi:hypothetical protein
VRTPTCARKMSAYLVEADCLLYVLLSEHNFDRETNSWIPLLPLPRNPSHLALGTHGEIHPLKCHLKPIPLEGDVSSALPGVGPACCRKEDRSRILPLYRLNERSFLSAQPLPRSEPYGWGPDWTHPNERTLLAATTIDRVGSFNFALHAGHIAAPVR